MSLSTLLLGKPKKVDAELDALFKSNPVPPRNPVTAPAQAPPPTKKRKIEDTEREKKKKRVNPASPAKSLSKLDKSPAPSKKSKKPLPPPAERSDESNSDDDSDDDDELETAYLRKTQNKKPKQTKPENESSEREEDADHDSESDSDAEADAPPLTHESLLPSSKRVRVKSTKKKTKFIPENESSAQRDARTIFVGGLPVEVAEKKQLKKQLSRHILSFLPASSQGKIKIESIRFRSAAFQKPSNASSASSAASKDAKPNPNASEHSKSRAAKWRDNAANEEEKEDKKQKEYLTPAQKKKVMFIKGEFHAEGRGLNAYVVLAHPLRRESVPDGDVDMEADTADPYEAALEIARAANLSTFMDVPIRVDVCRPQQQQQQSTSNTNTTTIDAFGATGDPKLSLFVGNLEFGSQERDVMEFFEGVVAGERGPAPASAPEDGIASSRWVQSVRLIRDPETQLGKGFGYVRFADRECVDEVLSLVKTDEGKKKLKFAKRVLRVQRCRATTTTTTSAKASSSSSSKAPPTAASSPAKSKLLLTPPKRGDPSLGERLAHLGKEERKAAKKADKDREGRRAEKKARMKMKMKVKTPADVKGKSKGVVKGKERERVRKVRVAGGGGAKGRK
ncbi:hypothetical protein C8F01DRAFT_265852 [Mycena amicta]|nr:hypothetical protein C8F01DRAFT_265852 [Mycena amicta]